MRTQTTSNETVEMYLKTIAELDDGRAPVMVNRIAQRLGVSPVSANEMVRRLAGQGLLVFERYKGVSLTDEGLRGALSVIRRQRLWECFLADHLKFEWAGVYEMACRLEHATSAVLAEALAAYLGHPTTCPHGSPIPAADGTLPQAAARPLTALRMGETGRIESILPTTTEVFAYLNRHHVLPRRPFTVVEIAPMEGPITLKLDEGQVTLGRAVADLIRVGNLA